MGIFGPSADDFLKAVKSGHNSQVRKFLGCRPGLILSRSAHDGSTALYEACRNGHTKVVDELLERQPGLIDITNKHGWTSIHVASRNNHKQIVRRLVKCRPGQIGWKNKNGETALHFASRKGHLEIARILLEHDPGSVDCRNGAGWTPLHIASEKGHLDVVRLLLSHGADIAAIRGNCTPLDLALKGNEEEIVHLLLEEADNRAECNHSVDCHSHEDKGLWERILDIKVPFRVLEDDEDTYSLQQWLLSRDLFDTEESLEIARLMRIEGIASPKHFKVIKKSTIAALPRLWGNISDVQKDKLLYMYDSKQGVPENMDVPCGKIFICHTGQDQRAKDLAAQVAESLRGEGLDYFFDAHSLRAGMRWKREIERSIQKCQFFVCVLSKTFFSRYWCMHELDMALLTKKRIIPVYFECEPPEANNLVFQRTLRKKLNKERKNVSNIELERWFRNMTDLKEIQAIRNESLAKDSQVILVRKVRNAIREWPNHSDRKCALEAT